MLLATFRMDLAIVEPAVAWIEEFFARNPRSAAPGDSPIWSDLARVVRAARPMRCWFPIAGVSGTQFYRSYRIGGLAW